MCCDGWEIKPEGDDESLGECPDCGAPVVILNRGDAEFHYYAVSGCNYSPILCKTCGDAPCDQSC